MFHHEMATTEDKLHSGLLMFSIYMVKWKEFSRLLNSDYYTEKEIRK